MYNNLTASTEIYYTGDAANIDGWGIITKRFDDQWGIRYTVLLDDGRFFTVSPSNFDGIGRRFFTRADHDKEFWERHEQLKARMYAQGL